MCAPLFCVVYFSLWLFWAADSFHLSFVDLLRNLSIRSQCHIGYHCVMRFRSMINTYGFFRYGIDGIIAEISFHVHFLLVALLLHGIFCFCFAVISEILNYEYKIYWLLHCVEVGVSFNRSLPLRRHQKNTMSGTSIVVFMECVRIRNECHFHMWTHDTWGFASLAR